MSYVNVAKYTLAWKYPALRAPGESKKRHPADKNGTYLPEGQFMLDQHDGPSSYPETKHQHTKHPSNKFVAEHGGKIRFAPMDIDQGPEPTRPWLSRVVTIRIFVALLTFIMFVMCADALIRIAMMPVVEVLFEVPTTSVGLIVSSFEFGQIILLLFFGYVDPKISRPTGVFIGGITVAISGVLWAIPHFIYGPYGSLPAPAPMGDAPLVNTTTPSHQQLLCSKTNTSLDPSYYLMVCAHDPQVAPGMFDFDSTVASVAYWILFASQILLGAGFAPFSSLGVAYVSANANPANIGLYLGIVFSVAILGLIGGFVIAGALAVVPIDLNFSSGVDPSDPSFLPAWWFGPLVCAGVVFLLSLPLALYPKEMSVLEEPTKMTAKKAAKPHKTPSAQPTPHDFKPKDFCAQIAHLFCNGLFMTTTLGLCCVAYMISGLYSFLPKYIETQFHMPPYQANIITAVISMAAMSTGIFFGSWISSKLKLTPIGAMRMLFGLVCVSLAGLIALMFIGCPDPKLAGTVDAYGYPNMTSQCNADCHCGYGMEPLCGAGNINYFSPCYAGCKGSSLDGKVFTDCSCVEGGTAQAGWCEEDCLMIIPYCIIMFICSFSSAAALTPAMAVVLRAVDEDLNSMALGLNSSLMSALAMIPGPLLFGLIIDTTCKAWMPTCQGRGSCLLHDHAQYRLYLHGAGAGAQGLGLLFLAISWVLLRWKEFIPTTEIERQHNVKAGLTLAM